MPDYRLPVGVLTEGGFKQGLGNQMIGVIQIHVDFPEDDIPFPATSSSGSVEWNTASPRTSRATSTDSLGMSI